jgi:peptide chain release factor
MILLQLSAAKGPEECCLAVAKALGRLQLEAKKLKVEVSLIEHQEGQKKGTYKSILCSLNGEGAQLLAQDWTGSMQWSQPSPYRPSHKRKNCFFGGEVFKTNEKQRQGDIQFQFCRASAVRLLINNL